MHSGLKQAPSRGASPVRLLEPDYHQARPSAGSRTPDGPGTNPNVIGS